MTLLDIIYRLLPVKQPSKRMILQQYVDTVYRYASAKEYLMAEDFFSKVKEYAAKHALEIDQEDVSIIEKILERKK